MDEHAEVLDFQAALAKKDPSRARSERLHPSAPEAIHRLLTGGLPPSLPPDSVGSCPNCRSRWFRIAAAEGDDGTPTLPRLLLAPDGKVEDFVGTLYCDGCGTARP